MLIAEIPLQMVREYEIKDRVSNRSTLGIRNGVQPPHELPWNVVLQKIHANAFREAFPMIQKLEEKSELLETSREICRPRTSDAHQCRLGKKGAFRQCRAGPFPHSPD